MKKLTKKNLDELAAVMPVISEIQKSSIIGGNTVHMTLNREFYGSTTTLGHFVANAYDDSGHLISTVTGFILEPQTVSGMSGVSGSDTSIAAGSYNVVPSKYHGASGYYEVANVPGRTGIKIHAGNTGADTEGCLMPGLNGSFNNSTNDSTISSSRASLDSLTKLFDENGDDGISITINGSGPVVPEVP